MSDQEGAQLLPPPPVPGPARLLLSAAALALTFAVLVGFALGIEGLALGWVMIHVGALGGAVLGAALGLGVALWRADRRTRPPRPLPLPWLSRAFPAGRAASRFAWVLALLLLASPYALLWKGGLPPLDALRLGVTALLAVLCFLQCARSGSFWPALVIPLWPVLTLHAMTHHYPCWQASNAAWCGHACDGPPDSPCGEEDFGVPGSSHLLAR
ncbi:hypothetical protein [Chondromyces apiculatus]|uniref:Uncharacterized protein n=1 Tax=Chondromyces apiculatus DSM 436 TaxID=1192034 RepID=A0A017SYW1_9BACT|nr:hypothetical protein [Chondromyces apiculatus]EYF01805.1 Hypothetical protein CAP_7758 [Chondromyces apiculatus DSM 436]